MTAPPILAPFPRTAVAVFTMRRAVEGLAAIEDTRLLTPEEANQADVFESWLELLDHTLEGGRELPYDHVDIWAEEAERCGGVALASTLWIEDLIPLDRPSWRKCFPFHIAGIDWAGIAILTAGLRVIAPASIQLKKMLRLRRCLEELAAITPPFPSHSHSSVFAEADAYAAKLIDDADTAFASVAEVINDDILLRASLTFDEQRRRRSTNDPGAGR